MEDDQIHETEGKRKVIHRWVIVTLCALVFLSIVPLFMFVGKNFLPVDDQSQFEISVRVPEGSSLGQTSQIFEQIASEIRKIPGVTDTLATVGGGQQQVVNAGTIYVKLANIKDRPKRQELMMDDARELLKQFPPELRTGVQQVQAFSGGGFRNANVQFLIAGPDIAKLTEYSEKIAAKMKTVPDAVDVDSTLISGKPEVQLEVDRVVRVMVTTTQPRVIDFQGVEILDGCTSSSFPGCSNSTPVTNGGGMYAIVRGSLILDHVFFRGNRGARGGVAQGMTRGQSDRSLRRRPVLEDRTAV
mgnify:CR=1 FL=1